MICTQRREILKCETTVKVLLHIKTPYCEPTQVFLSRVKMNARLSAIYLLSVALICKVAQIIF